MKVLNFEFKNTWYTVSLEKETLGHVVKYGNHTWLLPHSSWVIIGFSYHHIRNHPDRPVDWAESDPKCIVGCYVWDKDHGTTRTWRGVGNNRITTAYTTTLEGEKS